MSALAQTLAPIWAELSSIKKRLPSVSPATVTSVGPVRIQVDGQAAPVAASPDSLVPVGPGDRVRVLRYGTTHLIIGRVNNAGIPFRMWSGRVGVTGTGALFASDTFPFPVDRFTATPIVSALSENSNYNTYTVPSGTSATHFRVGVRRLDGQDFTTTAWMQVIAVQMTPTSAEG